MIHAIGVRLGEVIAGQPGPVLPSASIGSRPPIGTGELPALTVSIAVDKVEQLGFGRLVRGSEQLPGGDQTRDDLRGDQVAGTISLELWAVNSAGADQLARAIDLKLDGQRPALRSRGFAALRPAALDAMESLRHDPGVASAFSVWRQRLAYRFVFEWIEGGELSDGGLIERVDVDLIDQPGEESFSAPSTTT